MHADDFPSHHRSTSALSWTRLLSAAFGSLIRTAREAFAALGRELVAIRPNASRASFCTHAMLSVELAVALAYTFHFSHIWWAAISGFAVMQTKFSACAQRGVHRLLGAITALMVTFEVHTLGSASATASFALMRVGDVMVGTLSCVAISALFHAGVQQYKRKRGVAPMSDASAASGGSR